MSGSVLPAVQNCALSSLNCHVDCLFIFIASHDVPMMYWGFTILCSLLDTYLNVFRARAQFIQIKGIFPG